jgi:hypothetical protein
VFKCHSKLIPGDIERAMEDAEDIDVPFIFDEIGKSIMP